jgi:hypothetical protein
LTELHQKKSPPATNPPGPYGQIARQSRYGGRLQARLRGPGDKQAGMHPSGLYEAAGRERVPGDRRPGNDAK